MIAKAVKGLSPYKNDPLTGSFLFYGILSRILYGPPIKTRLPAKITVPRAPSSRNRLSNNSPT
jgi:hypothetical protein